VIAITKEVGMDLSMGGEQVYIVVSHWPKSGRERPRGRRAAEQRDELPASHSITSSCFGVGMTRLVNEQNIRTLQRVENRACNDPGILTADMKPISCGLPCVRVMCIEYSIRN
jgi:hypothetical protein